MSKLKIVASLLLVVIGLFYLLNQTTTQQPKTATVTASNFAIYDIVKNIATPDIEVVCILPFGVDPHSFEPSPKAMVQLERSALFFYSGEVLEPWTHQMALHAVGVDLSKQVNLLEAQEDEEQHEEHHHHNAPYDPHYWLDIQNMQTMTRFIAQKLAQVYLKDAQAIKKNTQSYIEKLQKLDELYQQKLSSCKQDTIVVTHNAFGYLAHRYGFEVHSLTGLSTQAQATPQDVVQIFDVIRQKGIKTIFAEDFSNQKEIRSIANEVNISLDTLQPLGNITAKQNGQKMGYIAIMKQNLQKLAAALECQ
ncbi:MAG: zinc ABC transporter substrate-binding protein [Epsilonproteobacteria bacterium]|nr:zinc ABC transporter substrate-binding protein [Campylobacterota bacterium]